MLTTAGSTGFSTDANPFEKLLSGTGTALRSTANGSPFAPTISRPVQCRSPEASNPPPINAARITTVATQRRTRSSLPFIDASPLSVTIAYHFFGLHLLAVRMYELFDALHKNSYRGANQRVRLSAAQPKRQPNHKDASQALLDRLPMTQTTAANDANAPGCH